MVHVRKIAMEDAEAYLQLCRQLDEETSFMLYEPGERETTVPEERARLASMFGRDNQTAFVAEVDGRIVGHIQAMGGHVRRNRRTVYLVIGILQAYTGQGIGTALFRAVEAWARTVGVHRLELTVMTHNEAAIGLYRKMGFQIEGTARETLFVDGRYVDEYWMAKLLA
ncbi:GNAT family N-acetyltransferase [Alicyclobacillus acidoterrestris]|uniref:GNAT family N-acetyltransferase n=1 Tax=Alicyclobacillus acidoterrestris (strain ATCC 49025 / DSM 3922 / CIP 106132 / NCIMB 13137 / GD3B) TaxID=1356854 RepID=A0A9E6ZUT7_ALIAG|nr:GNAT family protein [Alicyclobacillus acidoterrestris]UNO50900.1 GNAT family N-acetyltransferase [Alicyclobacillus acidoterrestris]